MNQYFKRTFPGLSTNLSRLFKLQPVFALATSITCILLFRRGFEFIPVIIVFVVFALFYITYKIYLAKGNEQTKIKIWDMALLFALNNMLLFALPFYLESITLRSWNILFAPIIIGVTIITNWYYIYQNIVMKNPLFSSFFFAVTFFCVLNLLLPVLFGIRNIWSLLISGTAASILSVIFVYPHISIIKNRKNHLKFIAGVFIFFIMLWFGRSIVPPAPLRLIYASACEVVQDFNPQFPFKFKKAGEINQVFFFTSIFAPRGLREKVNHVWFHNGIKLVEINLREIRGGREKGFRTWSSHIILEGAGEYTIEVWTHSGQMLGRGGFILK